VRAYFATITLALIAIVAGGCSQNPSPTASQNVAIPSGSSVQPYAGLQERDIRALAPERVADLLAGRGTGYALAAELNHYPGPTHVLELGAQLELSAEQQDAVSSIKTAMQHEAVRLGAQLVDREEELDRAFRSGAITPQEISSLTSKIADVEGKLRNIHLQAHVQTVEVLTEAQVARYDDLRGYVRGEGPQPSSPSEHSVHGVQH